VVDDAVTALALLVSKRLLGYCPTCITYGTTHRVCCYLDGEALTPWWTTR